MIVYKVKYTRTGRDLLLPLAELLSRGENSVVVDRLTDALTLAGSVPEDGEYLTFVIPTPTGMEMGFVWDDDGLTYVASPWPLPWMEAYQNIGKSEPSANERAAMEHKTTRMPRVAEARPDWKWRTSQSGNATVKYKGFNITCFRNKRGGGFAGIVSSGDAKAFTDSFPTEEEVQADIEERFAEYRDKVE